MSNEEKRHIVHFDLDAFFVSVELLRNSELRGKPLIVGGGDRGVVAACSYEARKFGVRSAMPIRQARFLCPDAIIISGDYEEYSKHSRIVTEIISEQVPVCEKASIDEHYADLTGMDRFFNLPKFITELNDRIKKQSGLPITYALASNKLVSKVATNEVKPSGQITIPFGQERSYLSPLAVGKLPGVGEKTNFLLNKMGVNTVKVLSEIPEGMLAARFGKHGTELSRKSKGQDNSPVVPYSEQKSISTEETFHEDTMDVSFLRKEIVRMTEKIAFDLRSQGKLTGCVTVKVRYSDFNTVTKQRRLSYTNADHTLFHTAQELFNLVYDKRVLIRLLGVRFTDLVQGTHQIDLFSDTQEHIQLYQAIDSIKRQFGEKAVMRACGIK